jgi:hypothetical protein
MENLSPHFPHTVLRGDSVGIVACGTGMSRSSMYNLTKWDLRKLTANEMQHSEFQPNQMLHMEVTSDIQTEPNATRTTTVCTSQSWIQPIPTYLQTKTDVHAA